jgi:hypothetical protein
MQPSSDGTLLAMSVVMKKHSKATKSPTTRRLSSNELTAVVGGLMISNPEDVYEREADGVAGSVIRR